MASKIEDGPTNGTTVIPFWCAKRTTSAPGSATPGHPASETSPTETPCLHGFRYVGISEGSVNLFKENNFKSDCDFEALTDLINRRADFSFSTI